jgi:RNA polymerase sigma-70 factor, ECF subfamily
MTVRAALSMPRFLSEHAPSNADGVDADDAIDVALMRETAKGNEQAFRKLIERHQQAVVGTVARMLNDATEAEDIAQMVFLRIWQSAPKWTHDAKFTTYLFTITRNLVFNESRRRTRKKEVSLEAHEENHPDVNRADDALAPAESMVKRELHRTIDRAIAALPEQQRMAVVLRTFEGLDYEDIAAALDTSVSSVKSLLFRARTALREALADEMQS